MCSPPWIVEREVWIDWRKEGHSDSCSAGRALRRVGEGGESPVATAVELPKKVRFVALGWHVGPVRRAVFGLLRVRIRGRESLMN
jgi:hypothetical protein